MKAVKKLLSIFLVFALIVAAIPISVSAAGVFAGGTGSKSDPYRISSKSQLSQIRNYPSSHFILNNDIVFRDADFEEGGEFYNGGYGWFPIKNFYGSINGNGHSIENLCIYNEAKGTVYTGFISVNEGDIYDLTMYNCYIIGEGVNTIYTGAIAGSNSGNIFQCYSTDNLVYSYNAKDSYAGGICGKNSGTITLCINTSMALSNGENLALNYVTGGITGITEDNGILTYCYNYGYIYGKTAGGIAGHSNGSQLLLCYNGGDVNDDTSFDYICSGGIVGFNSDGSTVSGCINAGTVFAYSSEYYAYAGGIAGYNEQSQIDDSYNTGDISATATETYVTSASAGGIVGYNTCDSSSEIYTQTVATVYNRGSITASVKSSSIKKYIGGIAGSSDSPITSSYYLNNTTKGIGNNTANTDGTKKLTNTQMKSAASYEGFDLKDMWWLNSKSGYDYPQLTLLSECPAEEIVITEMPDTTFYAGEEPDLSGGKMKVTYSNGASETLDTGELSILLYDPNSIGKQTVSAVYAQFIVTLELNFELVNENPDEIIITSLPSKLTYVQGQPLDISDAVITAVYGENITAEIDTSELEISYDNSALGEVEVTVSYKNKTATFNIEVVERVVTDIEIHSLPTNVVYKKGSELLPDGGILKVFFDSEDNYSELLEISADMLSDCDMNTVGKQTVTVTFGDKTVSFDIHIVEATPGDVNGDGITDTSDLAALKLYLAGAGDTAIVNNPGNADCNCDTVVDTGDLARLKLILASG